MEWEFIFNSINRLNTKDRIFSSVLRLHGAGLIDDKGALMFRGLGGFFQSKVQAKENENYKARVLVDGNGFEYGEVPNYNQTAKHIAGSVRCIKD